MYRSPKKISRNYQLQLEEELSHIITWMELQYQTVIIIGDLNLNRMKPESAEGKLLLDLEVEHGLQCMITSPTRVQTLGHITTHSLIDVIFTHNPELFKNCGVYDPGISDHVLVYGFIKEKFKSQRGKIIKFR